MDPITAWAAAQAALQIIRKCIDFYKEAKQAGHDVMEITTEVSGHIGKFMDASEVIQKHAEEQKKIIPKKNEVGINSRALDNVLKARQLADQERELREYLIYHTPGLGAIWEEFVKERNRIRHLQEQQEQEERRQAYLKEKHRREMFDRYYLEAIIAIALIILAAFIGIMFSILIEDRIKKYPHLGTEWIPVDQTKKPEPPVIYIGR